MNKPILLDFYADWCVSCKEWDANVFSKQETKTLLNAFILARADITNHDQQNKLLMKNYGVVAPPTILFFSPEGTILSNQTIVGQMSANQFGGHLQEILQAVK